MLACKHATAPRWNVVDTLCVSRNAGAFRRHSHAVGFGVSTKPPYRVGTRYWTDYENDYVKLHISKDQTLSLAQAAKKTKDLFESPRI